MVLRPGEAITWRWGHADPGEVSRSESPDIPTPSATASGNIGPTSPRELWKKGAASVEGVESQGGELIAERKEDRRDRLDHSQPVRPRRRPARSGRAAGRSSRCRGTGNPGTRRGRTSTSSSPPMARHATSIGSAASWPRARVSSASASSTTSRWRRSRCRRCRSATTRFVYTDQSPRDRQVRITHDWVERSASRPPDAPATSHLPAERWRTSRERGSCSAGRRRRTPDGDPDRRLPLRALGSAGHGLAALDELLQADLEDAPIAANRSTRCRTRASWPSITGTTGECGRRMRRASGARGVRPGASPRAGRRPRST